MATSVDYGYVNARIRGMKSRLLGQDVLDLLISFGLVLLQAAEDELAQRLGYLWVGLFGVARPFRLVLHGHA
jgi:hypothetical protein